MTTTLTSQDQEEATQQDQAYVVTGIEFEYAKAIPGLPDSQSIFDIEINLSRVIDGWVGPDKPGEPTTIALGLIGSDAAHYSFGAEEPSGRHPLDLGHTKTNRRRNHRADQVKPAGKNLVPSRQSNRQPRRTGRNGGG